ncbi:MAG: DUF2971 domain-containing protein [Chromatiaceae bacterium]|jgi:hypothetical protein
MDTTSIYKFFGFSDSERDLITVLGSELFFNSVDGFNDPFEAKPVIKPLVYDQGMEERYFWTSQQIAMSRGVPEEVRLSEGRAAIEYLRETGKSRTFEAIRESFSSLMADVVAPLTQMYGVTCFATDSGVLKASAKEYMWFHYGNGLRGLCLEFDKDVLVDSIYALNPQEDENHQPHLVAKDVNYVHIRPELDAFRFLEVYSLYQHDLSQKQWIYDSLFYPTLFTKPLAFAAEREFRIILEGAVKKKMRFSPSAVRAVYIGERMESKLKQDVIGYFLSAGVTNIQEVQIDHESYDLKVTPITPGT